MCLLSLCLLLGCPKSNTTKPTGPSNASALAPFLTIPPGAKSARALADLGKQAGKGDMQAAWLRVHYLLDLFDDARFRRSGNSLPLLVAASGDAKLKARQRGSAATDRALAFLLREVDVLLLRDRRDARAQNARTLIEFDNTPLVSRSKVFQRMVELKGIARGGGPLAANAMLRLFGYCRTALHDATRAPWARRMTVLSHCLYPLYDADPEPYFAANPNRRPPPPQYKPIVKRLTALAKAVANTRGRLAAAGRELSARLSGFVLAHANELPVPPDPLHYHVPIVAGATFYDWTPILDLGRATKLDSVESYAKKLRLPIRGDGRHTLAVAIDARGPAAALIDAAKVAMHAGADRLQLLVGAKQTLQVPAGDYWYGRISGQQVTRLATLPVSLAPLVRDRINRTRPDGPRGSDWDPARAKLDLHLVIDRDYWRLVSPTGKLAKIAVSLRGARPIEELRRQLARVRAAYDTEDSLILVPRLNTTYSAFVSAAAAALRDAKGRRLMLRLGLRAQVPKVESDDLQRLVTRRATAKVTATPNSLGAQVANVRSCYQTLLETAPRLGGTFYVEPAGNEVKVVRGPKRPQLRDCVTKSLGNVLSEKKISQAKIVLAPR